MASVTLPPLKRTNDGGVNDQSIFPVITTPVTGVTMKTVGKTWRKEKNKSCSRCQETGTPSQYLGRCFFQGCGGEDNGGHVLSIIIHDLQLAGKRETKKTCPFTTEYCNNYQRCSQTV
ncbi:uncharacterized protein LOC144444819 [Glandiceps talaboti]